MGRFHKTLQLVDDDLKKKKNINEELFPKLIQGPLSDIMSHIGQLAMLRRISGVPIDAERFTSAEIEIGRVGASQSRNIEPYKE
jgi:hypothetical protein